MPASYTTIKITGGTADRVLTDGVDYQLQGNGYRSIRPRRSRAALARATPYDEVIGETIAINIIGANSTDTLDNKEALDRDLDQAERWQLGNVGAAPILIQVQAQGSDLNPLKSVIRGGRVILPDSFYDMLMVSEIEGAILEIDRLPVWLGDEDVSTTSSALANPNIMSVTFFGTHLIPSPALLVLDGFATAQLTDFYLLVAAAATALKIIEAEGATDNTTAGTWSTPTDAGKNPRGGNIGRWTAGDTNWQSIAITPPAAVLHKDVVIFAAVRVNSSVRTWQIKADTFAKTGGSINGETRPITLDYNGGDPQIVPIGYLSSVVGEHTGANIYFRVDSATGTPTIDFDYFVMMGLDGETNKVIKGLGNSGLGSTSFDLTFDHRLLDDPEPAIIFTAGGVVTPIGYKSPPIIYTTGGGLSAVFLATFDDQWVHTNAAKSAVSSLTIEATRRLAYLSPA